MSESKDTIQFNFDEMNRIYKQIETMRTEIYDVLDGLEQANEDDVENMKGQYRKGFEDMTKLVMDKISETTTNLDTLCTYINASSVDFGQLDMTIEKSIE